MKPEEQRRAIAEFCGWKAAPEPGHSSLGWGASGYKPYWHFDHQLPNYLDDLNAMHEAEKQLGEKEQEYAMALLLSFRTNGVRLSDLQKSFLCIHATAAQRAEALLKTIGKWRDE